MPGFYDIEWDNSYQLSLHQTYHSQLVINRWFYICPEPYVGALSSVLAAFIAKWIDILQPIQSANLTYDKVVIAELFGERQTAEELVGEVGGNDQGQDLPAFFGARYRLSPFNTRVRKGRKIFSGQRESAVQGDDIDPVYVTVYADVALAMNDVITAEGQDLLPSLLSPANTKHTGNIITQITSCIWSGWSTQSSRKIGRGA